MEELGMKQEKLCESEDMTMEELGVENSRVDEVRERMNMMAMSREAAMQTDPTKVIFPPSMSAEDRVRAIKTMDLARELEKMRQPLSSTLSTGQFSAAGTPRTNKDFLQDIQRQLEDAEKMSSSTQGLRPNPYCYEQYHFPLQTNKANDRQVGGSHYKDAGVEPWDVIDTWPKEQQIGGYRSGALKYIMRAGDKDPFKQDIAKAHHYLEKLLEILE